MTTSSTPGNSPINFLFTEISHQGKILNYEPNRFTNKKTLYIALVITTYASLNSASFTARKSLYLPSHFLSVVISALFCECTHIQFCFFTRGEWLKYIHIINQKRIEKIMLRLIILERYISQNQGINLSWIIITKHIVGNHQTNSSKFLLF